jgi:hypothetical protein
MELSAQDTDVILRDSAAALQAGAPGTPGLALMLIALFLQFLLAPIVDVSNWQRIAGFEMGRNPDTDNPDSGDWARTFKRLYRTYAVESPLIWLFMTASTGGGEAAQNFVSRLAAQQNTVAALALMLFVLAVFAMALSTMSALFSAILCVVRYDVLPAISPASAAGGLQPAQEADARRRAIGIGTALCVVPAALLGTAAINFQITFTATRFLALLFALSCLQLAFVPLVLAPCIGRARAGGAVSTGWALVTVVMSAAAGVGAVVVYLATGQEPWLWAAVPACLGSGMVLFVMARLFGRKAAPVA